MNASVFNSRFDQHVEALKRYAAEAGTCDVPNSYVWNKDGTPLPLGRWVSYIKSRYNKGRLPQQRVQILEAVPGWSWKPRRPGPQEERQRNTEIRKMREAGLSLDSIANSYGLSKQRIHQICGRKTGETDV